MTELNKEFRPSRRRGGADTENDKVETFAVQQRTIGSHYRCNVDAPFESIQQFTELVQVLDDAGPGDIVEIKLATPGGSLQAVLPVMAAMANTQATIYVHAVSDVASAGTFLLMLADDVMVNPYVTIMFHQVSFGTAGPGNHVFDYVGHVKRTAPNLLSDLYTGFFSEEEMEQMLSGKEFWLTKEEFDERYEARKRSMIAEMEEEVAAMQAAAALEQLPAKPKRRKAE